VVASSATYSAPLTLDSILTCRLYAEGIGRSSFDLRMDALLASGSIAVSVKTRHVWCRVRPGTLEAIPVPDWLRELLAGDASPR
jgi:acyl-CoA thioesterase FadM